MKVTRWAQVQDWSPKSPQQVLAYLKAMSYPIYKNRKTKKPTSDNESLEKILRKYPLDQVLPRVLACRDLVKADGYLSDTYVGRDGRFHPEWTRHPETGRLAAQNPNMTNQPKPEKFKGSPDPRKIAKMQIAEAIISSICASTDCVLLERDYKAEESLLLGYFAGDQTYMRMARLGIYSYFLSIKVGKPVDLTLPDPEVRKQLDQIKKLFPFEYPLMKKTILARGYGEGVPAIARDLEPSFIEGAKEEALVEARGKRWWKEVELKPFVDPRVLQLVFTHTSKMAFEAAAEYVRIYESAAPKVVEFQHRIREIAHKERKLVNPWGYTRHWYDVFTKRDGKWVLGSEANQVLAYLPQSSGAAILVDASLELDKRFGSDPLFNLCILEHDKIVADTSAHDWEVYMASMREVMEAPVHLLGGLTIETEGKMGENWGLMRGCA